MPSAQIKGHLLDLKTKRVLVKEVTDALEKAFQMERDKIIVQIIPVQSDNLSIGGILLSERKL